MPKLRERAQRVDYSDFLSPTAEKTKDARDARSSEPAVADKPAVKAAKKSKVRGGRGHATDGNDSNGPKPSLSQTRSAAAPKRKQPSTEEQPADADDGKVEKVKSRQTKKKNKADQQAPPKAVAEPPEPEPAAAADAATAQNGASSSLEEQLQALKKKYDALRHLRETEAERLLQEAKMLADQEKHSHERVIARLKSQVATLIAEAEEHEMRSNERVKSLETEHQLRIERLGRLQHDAEAEVETLRKHLAEKEALLPSSEAEKAKPTDTSDPSTLQRAANEQLELAQAYKLLNLYRQITSTHMKLVQSSEEHADADEPTELSCTVEDADSGRRLTFDLAIPTDPNEEIEYLPPAKQCDNVRVPSYLQEEMSFKRSQVTRFMRTIYDVVIRKKQSADSETKG